MSILVVREFEGAATVRKKSLEIELKRIDLKGTHFERTGGHQANFTVEHDINRRFATAIPHHKFYKPGEKCSGGVRMVRPQHRKPTVRMCLNHKKCEFAALPRATKIKVEELRNGSLRFYYPEYLRILTNYPDSTVNKALAGELPATERLRKRTVTTTVEEFE